MTEKEMLKQDLMRLIKNVRNICKNNTDCDYCLLDRKVCACLKDTPSQITDKDIEEVLND